MRQQNFQVRKASAIDAAGKEATVHGEDMAGNKTCCIGREENRGADTLGEDRDMRASPLDGIDLFE